MFYMWGESEYCHIQISNPSDYISDEELKSIFDLFYTKDEARTKSSGKVHIIDINNLEAQKIVGYYDKLFIDIDKYSDFMSAKKDLLNFVYDIRDAYKHCYIRYPFLGYYDRYRFLTEKGILIEQLYF